MIRCMGKHKTNGKDPDQKPVSVTVEAPEVAEPTRKQEADNIGLTRGTVWKLRKRGMRDAEIAQRAAEWQEEQSRRRQRKIARQAGVKAMAAAKNKGSNTPIVSAAPPAASYEIPTYSECQRQKEYFLAQKHKLAYERERGSLVETERVVKWCLSAINATVQFGVLFPSQIRDELSATSDPIKCEEIVMREVRRMIEKIHDLETLWTDWDGGPEWAQFQDWKNSQKLGV